MYIHVHGTCSVACIWISLRHHQRRRTILCVSDDARLIDSVNDAINMTHRCVVKPNPQQTHLGPECIVLYVKAQNHHTCPWHLLRNMPHQDMYLILFMDHPFNSVYKHKFPYFRPLPTQGHPSCTPYDFTTLANATRLTTPPPSPVCAYVEMYGASSLNDRNWVEMCPMFCWLILQWQLIVCS